MPTYEYACSSCGTHIDVFQRFSEGPLTECGVCGGRLRKVFHPAGILFKGSGFYVTDSRKTSAKAEKRADGEKSDSGTKGDGETSDARSTDGAKPAASKKESSGAGSGATKERSA